MKRLEERSGGMYRASAGTVYPVLQQLEHPAYGDTSVNDAFRPLTRYFDRIVRPEQILQSLSRAIATMLDPASCGPVCLALPQDVQTEAFDCPASFQTEEPCWSQKSW